MPFRPDTWKVAERAESLGFNSIWLWDSPLVCGDVFAALASAAVKTSKIRLATGVYVPANRDPSVTASGFATINALVPDLHSGADPRYGRPGRIPGSVNLPAASLLEPETQTLPSAAAAADAFAAVGAAPSKRLIIYCGGGIAATLDAFVAHQLGYRDITVYDNSMSEWATDASLPIETD